MSDMVVLERVTKKLTHSRRSYVCISLRVDPDSAIRRNYYVKLCRYPSVSSQAYGIIHRQRIALTLQRVSLCCQKIIMAMTEYISINQPGNSPFQPYVWPGQSGYYRVLR